MSTSRLNNQHGLTLLEVIVSLGILSAASIGLATLASRYAEETLSSVSAAQIRTFGQASNSYIKDNYAAVQAIATPTVPAKVDVATLIAAGKLPAGFSPATANGKTLCTLVLEPSANRLQAMVVGEGGNPTNDLDLGQLAALVGGSGGGVYSSANTIIRGAVGGWSVPVATFDNLVNNMGTTCSGAAGNVRVITGTPVMALWFENGDSTGAFLARDAVPGRPELNAMNAPLVMNSVQTLGAACSSLGAISRTATGSVLSCNGGNWKSQGSAYWEDPVASFASLPSCTLAIAGQTRVATTPSSGTGPRAYSCDGATWKPLSVDDSGNLTLSGTVFTGKVQLNDVIVDGSACSTTGQLARDASGEIFSCQAGVWSIASKAVGLSITGEVYSVGLSIFPAVQIYSNTLLPVNPTNSQITIPKRGNYLLWAEQYTCTPGSAYAQVGILINGVPQAYGVSFPNSCDSSSAQVFRQLVAGDVVTVICGDNAGRQTTCYMTIVRP